MRDSVPGNPFAESRMFPTMLRGLVDPQTVMPIRSTPTDNAMRALIGEPAFAHAPLSREELERVNAMVFELRRIMDEEWGWEPRDLWDVQGFIWVTCQKKPGSEEDMTDEELLARFDSDPNFRERRSAWSEGQVKAFCRMARAVNDVGLDWYPTNIPELRFGRRELGARKAAATAGRLLMTTSSVDFSHSSPNIGLSGQFSIDEEGATAFVAALNAARDRIERWEAPSIGRRPFWPDEYADRADDEDRPAVAAPTNLILYGPPGTGKTYRTAREAVRLCDGEADYPNSAEGRAALMNRYRELVEARQVEMVTFHQSLSYEEFVEGLRPDTDGSGEGAGFSLKAESGLFARIADRAQKRVRGGDGGVSLEGRKIFKMSLGQSNDPHSAWVFEEALEQGQALFSFRDVDWSDPLFDNPDAILAELRERFPEERITERSHMVRMTDRFRNRLSEGDIIVASKGLNAFRAIGFVEGDYEYAPRPEGRYTHRRKVDWVWSDPEGLPVGELVTDSRFGMKTIYELPRERLHLDLLERLINSEPDDEAQTGSEEGELLPHVLIIDEINRANISKVFGELITLIEPDKRLGMRNALKVRLPYSKREFGVPANLHIIGTMNTADRSIALLDTALRRRFRFEEMAPDTTVEAFRDAEEATGLPLAKVLDTMNRRIEYLVDRDHRIGHAFFIGCETKADVDAVMRDKVIPLLQEYFFEDWNRLAAVLGEKDKGGNFLECDTIEDPMGEGGEPLKSWRVRDTFDAGAYDRLVSGKPSSPPVSEVAA
ncbi:MAG: AAA domain-containing protein [Erythrobacter sp.]|nr:MAG: AAA domain-containing protein [Erythrobacter sp.]